MRSLRAALLLSALAFVSCAPPSSSADPGVGMHVTWGLTEPSATIPTGVVSLKVFVFTGDDMEGTDSGETVANLVDMDGDGHDEVVRGDLPIGEPLRVVVEGEDAGGGVIFVGHAGPFVLSAGERRYIDMRMVPVGEYGPIDTGGLPARFLHAATSLPDGRVLITGGFTRATAMECAPGTPTGSHCFDLTASNDAFVYDPATTRLIRIQGNLRQARAGHTSTLLGDGRVLVAGGADHATLVLQAQTGGLVPILLPVDEGGAAATSFELFLPDANAETEDLDRDGDPGRGGFVGAADAPTQLGRLDLPRFMHAASVIPGDTGRVVLVGGASVEASESWAVFDAARAGGYGVLDSSANALTTARSLPSIATVGSTLWFLSGGEALDNAGLADRYIAAGGMGNGTLATVAMDMFPGGTVPQPGLNLWRPTTLTLGDGARAVVVGWLGPACEDGMSTPVFPDGPATYVRCGYDMTAPRSYQLAETGAVTMSSTSPVGRNPHAFGAGARLSNGTGIVNGGFVGLGLQTTNTSDHFAATGSVTDTRPSMRTARAFHTVSALEDRGVLVFGGMSVAADGTSITITAAPEVLYLR